MLKNRYFRVFVWWLANNRKKSTSEAQEQLEFVSNLGRMPRPWIIGEWAKESIELEHPDLSKVTDRPSVDKRAEHFFTYGPELATSQSKDNA
jgi:hypothetical protein